MTGVKYLRTRVHDKEFERGDEDKAVEYYDALILQGKNPVVARRVYHGDEYGPPLARKTINWCN